MKIKSIEISDRILSRFPNVSMGYLIAEDIVNEVNNKASEVCKKRLNSLSALQSVEQLIGVVKWRDIFTRMNAKKGKVSSVESLVSMYLENGKLPNINPIVNYYNVLSCFLGLPMGAYTIDNLPSETVMLREARKNEEFIPIGGKLLEKTSNGEIVYSSGETLICKLWNNKDAEISKITLSSKNILFIFDGADEDQNKSISEGLRILQQELTEYFNARINVYGILDAQKNQVFF
jgi:DNA/RNA-binding domain of Phe-tRNA-synthetase-like protein